MGPGTVGYAGAFLELIGLLAFIVFVAVLYDLLRRCEHERTWLPAAALGAGLVSAAIKIGSAPPMLAAPHATTINATNVRRTGTERRVATPRVEDVIS